MQDTSTNDQDNLTDSFTSSQPRDTSDGPVVDLPTIAAIALHNTPPWAGDIIASIPEEAGPASAAADAGATEPVACFPASQPSGGVESALRPPVTLHECPLHTAMRRLAEAAVAQHILYLEGEVQARPGLINAVSRWEHMHTLIRECICPATRDVSVGSSAVAEIVDAIRDDLFTPGQQLLRQQFVHVLEACAACTSTAECPCCAI